MANKFNWKICRRCHLPFIPYLNENQTICSWICERLEKEEQYFKRGENTMTCANCKKEIPPGTPYYIIGDNFLQMKYFDSDEDNVFCSHECICESLSVIEVPNDGSKTLSEALALVAPDKNTQIIEIDANVYPEDAEVNGVREHEPLESENPDDIEYKMPGICKEKVSWGTEWHWKVKIDIPTGKILNWPQGTTAKTWYKTSDRCGLKYLGKSYEEYVPEFLEIYDSDCGDYIYIEILENGTIKDWNSSACKKWLCEHIDEFNEIVKE